MRSLTEFAPAAVERGPREVVCDRDAPAASFNEVNMNRIHATGRRRACLRMSADRTPYRCPGIEHSGVKTDGLLAAETRMYWHGREGSLEEPRGAAARFDGEQRCPTLVGMAIAVHPRAKG